MTSTLRLGRTRDGEIRLQTRLARRVGYALGASLMVVGLFVAFEPARDLGPTRLPGTLLYLGVLLAAALAALSDRLVRVGTDPPRLVHTRRVAGLSWRTELQAIPDGAVVRLKAGKRPRYSLEIEGGPVPLVVDTSSWKADLEPMGRELARALGLSYESAVPGA